MYIRSAFPPFNYSHACDYYLSHSSTRERYPTRGWTSIHAEIQWPLCATTFLIPSNKMPSASRATPYTKIGEYLPETLVVRVLLLRTCVLNPFNHIYPRRYQSFMQDCHCCRPHVSFLRYSNCQCVMAGKPPLIFTPWFALGRLFML